MITPIQRRNLLVLAKYLESLPKDYKHFDMSAYFRVNAGSYTADSEIERNYALHNGGVATCGAAACAVGHGPSAGFLLQPQDFNIGGEVPDWYQYGQRVFCSTEDEPDDEGDLSDFEYMFGGQWSFYDDTPWGAAARIRHLLAGEAELDKFYSKSWEERLDEYKYQIKGNRSFLTSFNNWMMA